MDVEKIEDWTGQDVVGSDGEKIGKLEDVYYAEGTQNAQVGCVKAGLLGRKLYAVPLAGATVGRDHLTVAFTKDAVTSGPQVDSGEPLGPDQQRSLCDHFGVERSGLSEGTRYESAQGRAAQAKRAEELSDEVRDLEKQAAKKREKESKGEAKAQANAEEAEQLEERKRAAEAEASRLQE